MTLTRAELDRIEHGDGLGVGRRRAIRLAAIPKLIAYARQADEALRAILRIADKARAARLAGRGGVMAQHTCVDPYGDERDCEACNPTEPSAPQDATTVGQFAAKEHAARLSAAEKRAEEATLKWQTLFRAAWKWHEECPPTCLNADDELRDVVESQISRIKLPPPDTAAPEKEGEE